ncbi:MAG TPA: hypothetical protein DCR51_04795 [Idiomarina loihiensis]|jgi:hypothetical protein|nr:hypothetical protein [Idiomarinaceae bacterium]MAL83667.1 hypothetical protein [Idiomarina sp.]HAS22458.1 hypothetical protein [Idiomarina loihiensis]MAO67417.1 hypothetical protein [Idiomarina sp.]MBF80401.1 hypothetical protein [Idiomarina sp.]|tara:strand:- start:483 stop:668 length:186 start_codon:yes stop_codon:yes gene_type:complete
MIRVKSSENLLIERLFLKGLRAMTTGQLWLLLMLIVGLIIFFGIGIWGINRLGASENNSQT